MSAPQQLTQAQRDRLQTAHHLLRRREMVRHWLLSEEDRARIEERRRDHNRLGFAVQLCLLRYPGWPLGPTEDPPQNLLKFVAEQLGTDAAEVVEYSRRPQTRTDHAQELARLYRFRHYASPFPALLRAHLRAEALGNESAYTLMEAAFEWLRSQRVIVPALTTLESLIRSVRSEIERHVYDRIEKGLSGDQKRHWMDSWRLAPNVAVCWAGCAGFPVTCPR